MSTTDVTFAMEAKSDQLNACDIMGQERIIKIREVTVINGDQPVSVYFDGDNNRPWKPSKGMIRLLAAAWGTESKQWVGKSAQIYCDPTVTWAGSAVGGIRIRALSDIPNHGLRATIALSRQKREPYLVQFLDTTRPEYPSDKFDADFDKMSAAMQSGKTSLQTIIAHCQKTGDLTAEQITRLEKAAPVDIEHDGELPETNETEVN